MTTKIQRIDIDNAGVAIHPGLTLEDAVKTFVWVNVDAGRYVKVHKALDCILVTVDGHRPEMAIWKFWNPKVSLVRK